MLTVFGATGNTGSVVAERLLAAGAKVRAVVRDRGKGAALAAKGAELVVGDVTDAALVARALEGAEGAYLIVPPDLRATDLLAKSRSIVAHYVAGLTRAKVPHAVFLSSVGAQHASGTGPTRLSHEAERALRAVGGIRFTFVRAPFFMENLLASAHAMRSDGALPVMGGGEQHAIPMVAARDLADVAADALLAPPSATEIVEVRGPRDRSFVEAAAIASEILGRDVTTRVVPVDAIVPMLTSTGMSENVASLFRELSEGIARGLLSYEGTGRSVRGRVTLEEVLRRGLAPSDASLVVRRVFDEVVNQRRMELLPELFAADYVGAQGERGPAAFGALIEGLRGGFPDIEYVLDEVITQGERVAVRWSWSGTHRGAFRGIAPTGRAITHRGMSFFELRGGRITRSWTELDRQAFAERLSG
ncbi:ester cyclase [Sandaracinus amylolyticus]|uniref:NmrA-like domain-containing protein n=1 Tax=Sandaracinus amylolyticus TaxID=927083 RepID=A0A0F6W9W4_9BACT|nr:ester cyclase [Sandaracinus amylolyticus]AKF11065.1 Hypothetical protein DB32_008214 [Sandaracinus amylolyticus]